MRLTKLEYQKKDPNRVNVYIDGKFAAGIDANDILKLNLFNGKEIDSEGLNKILSDSEFGKLFNSALNFLSYRPRSEWEIRAKIKKRDSNLLADKVIEKLKQIGQVNDENFINWFIDQRRTFKPKGQRAIKYELVKKGINSKLIDKVLTQHQENYEETINDVDLATQAATKKFSRFLPQIDNPEDKQELKMKLQRFLLSRGFDYDTIKSVVEKLLKKEYND